ncbi:MAG: hypothetical protein ACRD9R_20265, partial [Pyrinomonadaceae bacterium]
VMYLGDASTDEQPLALSPALRTALVVAVVGILFIGVYPQPFINMAELVVSQVAAGALALR